MPQAILRGLTLMAGSLQENPAGFIRKAFQFCVLIVLANWIVYGVYGYFLARGGEPQREDRVWKINIPIAWDETATIPTPTPEVTE